MISKKFINSKDTVVIDSLKGLQYMMNECLDLVYDTNNTSCSIPLVSIKQQSLLQFPQKVRIICGGGSGHEPAHAGYVCL